MLRIKRHDLEVVLEYWRARCETMTGDDDIVSIYIGSGLVHRNNIRSSSWLRPALRIRNIEPYSNLYRIRKRRNDYGRHYIRWSA